MSNATNPAGTVTRNTYIVEATFSGGHVTRRAHSDARFARRDAYAFGCGAVTVRRWTVVECETWEGGFKTVDTWIER